MDGPVDLHDAGSSPFDGLIGTRLEAVSPQRVVATLELRPDHHQPWGVVHGGVLATLAETTASVGAVASLPDGARAAGISNHTDFLRPVREGRLRVEATPLHRGRRLQLWQVRITDDDDHLIAHARIRLANLDQQEPPGG